MERDIIKFIDGEIYNFNNYLKNPSQNFYLKPQSGDAFLVFIIVGFLSVMAIYYVCKFLGIIND